MARAKGGLGRGLGALIPDAGQSEAAPRISAGPGGAVAVPIESITPNPWQPRKSMPEESLQELAASIREHGLIQPLIVTRTSADPLLDEAEYQIIAGERRWQAAKLAGLTEIPVIVKDVTPREMLELALVENIQRADLNPLEEAEAYRQLRDGFGLTQEQVAERVGKSRVAIANAVRLLRLPDAVKSRIISQEISEGHARALLALEHEGQQVEALELIVSRGLNVRQTEDLVRRMLRSEKPKPPAEASDRELTAEERALEDDFRRALGTKVHLIRSKSGGGRLVIQFYSEEELQAIFEIITKKSCP
jgi:ParB family chromosome partitioning protein